MNLEKSNLDPETSVRADYGCSAGIEMKMRKGPTGVLEKHEHMKCERRARSQRERHRRLCLLQRVFVFIIFLNRKNDTATRLGAYL